ncbi:MAG: aldo/keto reductase, partial [Maribacter sp.]|nr:aldo/keto reductase [Maribacter sp.]
MGAKKQSHDSKRREFLQHGSLLTASAMLFPYGDLFGAPSPTLAANTVPTVTLNNGRTMPLLGFGTSTLNDATAVRCVSEAISVG